MMDIFFLAMLGAFGGLSWGFIVLCEKLAGGRR
jgi:hypothetical protein